MCDDMKMHVYMWCMCDEMKMHACDAGVVTLKWVRNVLPKCWLISISANPATPAWPFLAKVMPKFSVNTDMVLINFVLSCRRSTTMVIWMSESVVDRYVERATADMHRNNRQRMPQSQGDCSAPFKGMQRFHVKGKLAPRNSGLFKIISHREEVWFLFSEQYLGWM